MVREDRHVRMFQVEVLERVADRLHAAARLLGSPLDDPSRRSARLGQTPCPLDNPFALLVRQPAEPGAAANPLLVEGHEAIHGTLEKAEPLAAVEQESPTDQPLPAPSGDRFRRYAELPRQLVDRQHPFAGCRGGHSGRVGQVLDEQPQIMAGLFASEREVRVRLVAVVRDPMTNVLAGVRLFWIEFVEKFLRRVRLLDLLFVRRESHLLIAKLADGWAQIVGVHGSSSARL